MTATREQPNVQAFRTEDLALVTLLRTRGIECDRRDRAGKGCRWTFLLTSALREVVEEYVREEAFVEPREFTRTLARVKIEMHEFLGHTRSASVSR